MSTRPLGDSHIGTSRVGNGVAVGADAEANVACDRRLTEGEFCGVDHTCHTGKPVVVEGREGGELTTGQWSQSECGETVEVNGVPGGEFTVGAATQQKRGGESTVGGGTQENMAVLAGGDSIAGLGPLVNPNTSGGGEMQGGAVMGVMGGMPRGRGRDGYEGLGDMLRGGGRVASTGGGGAVVKPDVMAGGWSTAMAVSSSPSIVEVFSEAGVMSVDGKTQLEFKERETYSISLGFVRRTKQISLPRTDS